MFELLTQESYRSVPWKNGQGTTRDVLLLPAGASHENFDIRVSLAPIVGDTPFSAFPGIERVITCLSDNLVVLVFADGREVQLDTLAPYRFDSSLSPSTRLPAGESQVLNVMTRRGRCNATVEITHGAAKNTLKVPSGGMVIVHAAQGDCEVAGRRVSFGETMLVRDLAEVAVTVGSGSAALVATIERAQLA
ncbi:HutD/Ves family protein [Pseudaminobacter sp. NGMCC 1.201702]|uniref:HutD/Ves family protein n=1 Tax=Pseudaminobacter sp. NGMCC 1.201702 TaxID=3391825 RepID=UPI0039F020F3